MSLDQVFAALGDPTRRAMVAQLLEGEASVTELAAPHDLAQPTISKHLKVLEAAGIITTEVRGNARPRRLNPAALRDIDDWLAPFRAEWEARLDNLERMIADEKGGQ